jgi:hypothetical protein
VAEYSYCDERGVLLFQVVRMAPKAFRQRRPDSRRDDWIWNLGDVRRVLYRLDKLQGQTTVAIVEGEKDADRLWALGIPATCNPMGAGRWTSGDYDEQLCAAGVQAVYVFRDSDEIGERHAVAVQQSCKRAGLRAYSVHLPGQPKDVSAWLDSGHDADELRAVMTEAADSPKIATGPEITSAGTAISEPKPIADVVCLADVQPETVRWVWPGRIAVGKLGLVIGDPGEGKSFVLADIAARISRGDVWPDGARAPLGNVLFLSAEDGLADTMRPRLDRLGADVTRIHVLRSVNDPADPYRLFSLERDLPVLEGAVQQFQPLLIVIDPLTAYLGERDSYKDAEMRRLLTPLVTFAEKHGVAVEAVMHLTKATDRRAIHRMIGSVAFCAISRLVLAVARDPNDAGRRLVAGVKSNISMCAPALAFRLTDPVLGEQPMLTWEAEPVEGISADRLLGPSPDPEERDERLDADTLLRQLLTPGPMKALDVLKAAKENGISERTVSRAKKRIGVVSRHAGAPGNPGPWWWSLQDSALRVGDRQMVTADSRHPDVAISAQLSMETDERERSSVEIAIPPAVAVSGTQNDSLLHQKPEFGELVMEVL